MLQMVRFLLVVLIGTAAVSGCDVLDLKGIFVPTGDGVERRFEQSCDMLENLYSGSIEALDDYMFYVCTDPHIDKTYKCLGIFNDALRNDDGASFGVVLGDCTGKKDNLQTYLKALAYNRELHKYDNKLFHVVGNHDLFFNGWVDFKDNVGPSVFWFEVVFPGGRDLYVSLDTGTGSLGRRQTEWFKSFLSDNRSKYRHCIILTHTNFFYTDLTQASSGNMPVEESMALIDFLSRQNVSLVLQGHDHYREDLTYGNVRYTVLGSINDDMVAPEYLKVKVTSDEIFFDWIVLSSK